MCVCTSPWTPAPAPAGSSDCEEFRDNLLPLIITPPPDKNKQRNWQEEKENDYQFRREGIIKLLRGESVSLTGLLLVTRSATSLGHR